MINIPKHLNIITLSLKNPSIRYKYDKEYYKLNQNKIFWCQVFALLFKLFLVAFNLSFQKIDHIALALYSSSAAFILLTIFLGRRVKFLLYLLPFVFTGTVMAQQYRLLTLILKNCNIIMKHATGA